MANIIKPKRTTTPGNTPTTSNLAEGEIAINLADKKLFVRDTSNNILTLPGATDDLTVEGVFTTSNITAPSTTSTNTTDAAIKLETQWVYGGSTDVGAITYNFPVNYSAFESRFLLNSWSTENDWNYARLCAIDTGGGDDGSHDAELILHGSHNYIQSCPISSRSVNQNLTVKADNMFLEAADSITLDPTNDTTIDAPGQIKLLSDKGLDFANPSLLSQGTYHQINVVTDTGSNGLWKISSTGNDGNNDYVQFVQGSIFSGDSQFRIATSQVQVGQSNTNAIVMQAAGNTLEVDTIPQVTIYKDYSQTSGDVFSYVRRNNEDPVTPGNDSLIADDTETKFTFRIDSADASTQQLIGGITGRTHSTNGNQLQFTLDNQAQTGGANEISMWENRTEFQQPLAYPNFTQTEINAMSPNNGWVLYNDTTNKLQVYAGGAWVDLH